MSTIRRIRTEDWSRKPEPTTVPLRRVNSEPTQQVGWTRSFGAVHIHSRPLLEHEVVPLRRVSTSLRVAVLEGESSESNESPGKRLSLVIERPAARVPTRTTVTVELSFALRLLLLLTLVSSVSGLVVAMGRPGGGAQARTMPLQYQQEGAPWADLLPRPMEHERVGPASFGPAALNEAAAAMRQGAPLRAQMGLVRLCLAAEHAAADADRDRGIRSLSRRRVLTAHFSEALCALAFPAAFGAMRQWHERRAPSAAAELREAKQSVEATLAKFLPRGSYRVEGRVKSALSVFEKTVLRGKAVHDLCGLRVIVDADGEAERRAGGCSVRCEEVAFRVGEVLVNELQWSVSRPPKDYVTQPKPNGYQSLHLHLVLPGGAPLEVQVRTHCMHEAAERGSASHSRYKAAALGAWLHGDR